MESDNRMQEIKYVLYKDAVFLYTIRRSRNVKKSINMFKCECYVDSYFKSTIKLENMAEKNASLKHAIKIQRHFYQTIKYFNNKTKIVLLMSTYAGTELMFCLFPYFYFFNYTNHT